MKLKTYKDSLLFGLSQVTNYRSEVWLTILYRALGLVGVVFLWSLIGKEASVDSGINSLISYFLIANGVQGLVDAESLRFTRVLNEEIKLGTLSSHLLRPIHPIFFLYTSFLGTRGVVTLMSILLLVTGFMFLPSFTLLQFVLFLLSLIFAYIFGFIFNLLIGSFTFWTPEAKHLQNVASHILRVFGGTMIPLSFFSPFLKQFLLHSPFPAIAYLPSILLQSSPNQETFTLFIFSSIWVLILLPLSFYVWKLGLKRYEAIGI